MKSSSYFASTHFNRFELITKFSEGIDNQTLDDGKQDDNDEEEERDVKDDSINFVVVSVGIADFVTNTTASSYALVQMEHEARQHVVTLPVHFFLFLLDVEFTEEVEGDDSVNVDNDRQKHHSQNQLFSVVCDGLQNGFECLKTDSNIE
jgi:hypothetical protein